MTNALQTGDLAGALLGDAEHDARDPQQHEPYPDFRLQKRSGSSTQHRRLPPRQRRRSIELGAGTVGSGSQECRQFVYTQTDLGWKLIAMTENTNNAILMMTQVCAAMMSHTPGGVADTTNGHAIASAAPMGAPARSFSVPPTGQAPRHLQLPPPAAAMHATPIGNQSHAVSSEARRRVAQQRVQRPQQLRPRARRKSATRRSSSKWQKQCQRRRTSGSSKNARNFKSLCVKFFRARRHADKA